MTWAAEIVTSPPLVTWIPCWLAVTVPATLTTPVPFLAWLTAIIPSPPWATISAAVPVEVNRIPALPLRVNAVPEDVQLFVPVNRTESVPVASVTEAFGSGNVPDAVSKTVVEPVQS